jgi:hypothetical protein
MSRGVGGGFLRVYHTPNTAVMEWKNRRRHAPDKATKQTATVIRKPRRRRRRRRMGAQASQAAATPRPPGLALFLACL